MMTQTDEQNARMESKIGFHCAQWTLVHSSGVFVLSFFTPLTSVRVTHKMKVSNPKCPIQAIRTRTRRYVFTA